MDNLESIKIKHIEVYARSGAVLNKCIRDALLLSVKEEQDVILIHNEESYSIPIDDLLANLIIQGKEEKGE